MASLMDLRELGMLRNATQQMESGGGIDMDEWRRRKAAEEKAKEQSMLDQAMALNANDPRYQALISGAEGGPFAVGSVGNVAKSVAKGLKDAPFLRYSAPVARGTASVAKGLGRRAKKAVWKPKQFEVRNSKGEVVQSASKGKVKTGAYETGIGVTAGLAGAGLLYKDEISNLLGDAPEEEVMTPGIGGGGAVGLPQKKQTSDDKPPPEKTASLWETWGSLADDPRKRKQAYLGSIKNIYMKKMMLDSIANLTGGKSQGDSWAAMAIAELDAVEKFDSEERTHQKWKALFFNEDGTYNPPKDREEAIERGQKLNYGADELKDILTVFPKDTSDTAAMKNFKWYNSLEGSEQELVGRLLGITEDNIKQLSPSNLTSLINSDAFNEFETEERQEVIEIIKGLIPGFKGTPTFASKEEAQAAADRGEIKVNDKIIVDGQSGTWN